MTYAAERPSVDSLTPRQREVLALVERGFTNEEIAAELGISLDGAKWHVSEILGKLDVRSRHEAAGRHGAIFALAPLLALKKLKISALGYAAGAAVTAGAVAGTALLVWGALHTNSGADEPTGTNRAVPSSTASTPSFAAQVYGNPAFGVSLLLPASWVPDEDYGSFGGVPSSYADPAGRARGYALANAMSAESFDAAVDSVAHHKLQPFGVNPIIHDLATPAGAGKLILPDPERRELHDAAFIIPYPAPIMVEGAGGPYAYFSLDAHVDFIQQIAATIRFD